jgi:hypothetical protein
MKKLKLLLIKFNIIPVKVKTFKKTKITVFYYLNGNKEVLI